MYEQPGLLDGDDGFFNPFDPKVTTPYHIFPLPSSLVHVVGTIFSLHILLCLIYQNVNQPFIMRHETFPSIPPLTVRYDNGPPFQLYAF